jgi:xanthine dehydrogenase YagS FAD-binding subunit
VNPFRYALATDAGSAVATVNGDHGIRYIAGGTNIIDLMKDDVERPNVLLDITHLPLRGIVAGAAGVRLGALATMADVADSPAVKAGFPVVSQALLAGASPQLRNMATIGGNIMQRTRCAYFRDETSGRCNKRIPGSGCAALHGLNRNHAIFGWAEACVATNPSDLAVALAAMDAIVVVRRQTGERRIPFVEFHRLPASTPERDNVLERGDLIIAVEVPARQEGRGSHYLKIRDRQSYEFALVSVAAAVATDGRRILSARLAMGGVAHKPWRLSVAESALSGASLDDGDALKAAIRRSFGDARPLAHNAFKVELAQRAAVRALQIAGERT